MSDLLSKTVICCVLLIFTAAALAADSVEIRMKDGTRWRGSIDDTVAITILQQGVKVDLEGRLVDAAEWHVTLMTDVAGQMKNKTIFKADILSMRTVGQAPVAKLDRATRASAAGANKSPQRSSGSKPAGANGKRMGVMVLPLREMVGLNFRHEEIEAIAEEADKFGPGQIIVLLIDSGGGSVVEMEKIHESLTAIKKRHRLVAWIKKAISAACATALHCDEIYFMDGGTAGAMTAFNAATGQSLKDEDLQKWLRTAGDWAEQGGRSRYIAEAMIDDQKLLSYDKNPQTGQVTFYNNLDGQYILSRAGENLVFNSANSVHCGFADGIADDEQQLAKLLDMDEWYELSDYGRKISQDWNDTVERAQRELRLLQNRLSYAGSGSGDAEVIIGKQIQILQEVLRWEQRCPNCVAMQGIRREDIERQLKELRKQMSDMKKR